MSSNPAVGVVNLQEIAEQKAQKKREKRARQNQQRIAVSIRKCALVGSSDSDGYIPVELEDAKPNASKTQNNEIKGLERKLAHLQATRKNKTSSSTPSRVLPRCSSPSLMRSFGLPPSFHTRKVWWIRPCQVSPETRAWSEGVLLACSAIAHGRKHHLPLVEGILGPVLLSRSAIAPGQDRLQQVMK
eukprot:6491113-Amphidinium_carterae.1